MILKAYHFFRIIEKDNVIPAEDGINLVNFKIHQSRRIIL
jgi:hypothetical protein